MTDATHPQRATYLRGIGVRQVRLVCGLVLFAYLVSHFLNHALGNISLGALAAGVRLHMRFWQFPPIGLAFYAASAIHTLLGIWALYERRQFHGKAIEPLQLVLGLSIPAMIVAHVVGIRLGQSLFDLEKSYDQVFYAYWIVIPSRMWLMYLVTVISWVHGCIGLYFWLRLKPLFRRAAPFLLAMAVLIPTLALLGLYQGGRTVVRDSASPEWRTQNLPIGGTGTPAQQDVLDDITTKLLIGYAALVVLALAARGIRAVVERRVDTIALSYGDGRTVRVAKGLSVLEASLLHHLPHVSACGGRARCSTCRIRVVGDCSALPKPSSREAFILNRVGAAGDPAIRLACQLRPQSDLSFFQVFTPPLATLHAPATGAAARAGQERYLVSMFVDMRDSTKLAEKRLPFDTVFLVNRFLGAVSQAVIACDGQPNQFIGDGMLALFGLSCDPRTACRQALKAAAMIAANVDELNRFMAQDLREPIRFGIGIHAGEVIVGDIGYRGHMVFTALGDAVNVAARLQDMTKTLACDLVVSQDIFTSAGIAADPLPAHDVAIRGRDAPMKVRAAARASDLSALMVDADRAAV